MKNSALLKNFKLPGRPEIFGIRDFDVDIRNQHPEEHLVSTGNLDFSEKMVITGHPSAHPFFVSRKLLDGLR